MVVYRELSPTYRRPRRDSNPHPSDPKEWDPSDGCGWDAGSLTIDFKTRYAHLARFARYAAIFQEPRMR